MSALDRAEKDILCGDFALARQRMENYLNCRGYDEALLVRLAEISMQMHDPFSAGKYWFVSGEQSELVDSAVEAFLNRAGVSNEQIMAHLPLAVRRMKFEQLPSAAQERLTAIGLAGALPVIKRMQPPRRRRRRAGPLGHAIFVTILLFTMGSCSLGVKQMVQWFAD